MGGDTCELANFPLFFASGGKFASCIILEDLKKTGGNRTIGWYQMGEESENIG